MGFPFLYFDVSSSKNDKGKPVIVVTETQLVNRVSISTEVFSSDAATQSPYYSMLKKLLVDIGHVLSADMKVNINLESNKQLIFRDAFELMQSPKYDSRQSQLSIPLGYVRALVPPYPYTLQAWTKLTPKQKVKVLQHLHTYYAELPKLIQQLSNPVTPTDTQLTHSLNHAAHHARNAYAFKLSVLAILASLSSAAMVHYWPLIQTRIQYLFRKYPKLTHQPPLSKSNSNHQLSPSKSKSKSKHRPLRHHKKRH